MSIFEIHPVSIGRAFAAEWFDNDECLWDDQRLRCPASLQKTWTTPILKLHRPEVKATPVLFNPIAYAVSPDVRDELSSFQELEFLPVDIVGHGLFFVVHIVASCEVLTVPRFRGQALQQMET